MSHLSGYRFMWLMVMFDLPVMTAPERKAAAGFRFDLLDFGFEMAQYSVYLRCCRGKDHVDAVVRRVGRALPDGGRVDILCFTDKQYENILSFQRGAAAASRKTPGQFALF
jgi:CRISPR-associated protein Cas2